MAAFNCNIVSEKIVSEKIEKYNKIISNIYLELAYIHFHLAMEQQDGAGNYITEPINDSFFFDINKVNVNCPEHELDKLLNKYFGSSKIFLIIGGGPVGLTVASKLSEQFKDYSVLVVDNRVHKEHIRKPFTRARLIKSKGQRIQVIESELFTKLQTKKNVKFLFSKNIKIEDFIKKYKINFVFNASGGRLEELTNPPIEYLDELKKQVSDIGYVEASSEEMDYDNYKINNNYIVLGKPVVVITISQGQNNTFNYHDLWITETVTDEIVTAENNITYDNMMDKLERIRGKLSEDMSNIKSVIEKNFDISKNFNINHFEHSYKISIKKPCHMHKLIDEFTEHFVFKYDIGDSLGTLPIQLGTNLTVSERVIDDHMIDNIKEIIDLCLKDYGQLYGGQLDENFYKYIKYKKKYLQQKKYNF